MAKEFTRNPVAVRSRGLIVGALFELMDGTGFDGITMQMIADQAGVGRRTIYRHFSSKEDILNYYAAQMKKEYLAVLGGDGVRPREVTPKLYFSFWQRHLKVLKLLYKNDLMLTVLREIDETMLEITGTVRSTEMENRSAAYQGYYRAFYSGCYWKLLCQWVGSGAHETPEQMASIFRNIAHGVYEHLNRQS